jgi:hypothetical protein
LGNSGSHNPETLVRGKRGVEFYKTRTGNKSEASCLLDTRQYLVEKITQGKNPLRNNRARLGM